MLLNDHSTLFFLEVFSTSGFINSCLKVKVAQRVQLCDPMDYTVHGILQAQILEWIAYPFSSGSSDPGIELGSSALQADSLPAELTGKPIK